MYGRQSWCGHVVEDTVSGSRHRRRDRHATRRRRDRTARKAVITRDPGTVRMMDTDHQLLTRHDRDRARERKITPTRSCRRSSRTGSGKHVAPPRRHRVRARVGRRPVPPHARDRTSTGCREIDPLSRFDRVRRPNRYRRRRHHRLRVDLLATTRNTRLRAGHRHRHQPARNGHHRHHRTNTPSKTLPHGLPRSPYLNARCATRYIAPLRKNSRRVMIFGSNDLFRPRPTTPPAPADPSAGRDRPGGPPAEIGTATLVLTGRCGWWYRAISDSRVCSRQSGR